MLVGEWMSTNVVRVSPATSVLNARQLLDRYQIRHLPVVEGDRLVGIVSDRDLRGNDPFDDSPTELQSDLPSGRYRRVSTVMRRHPLTVVPHNTIGEATRLMVTRRINGWPVVDRGRLVGIVTAVDCMLALTAPGPAGRGGEGLSYGYLPEERAVPMGPGDDRPGRPSPRGAALVVDPDPKQRIAMREELQANGYAVRSCPGPSWDLCPAVEGADACHQSLEGGPVDAQVPVADHAHQPEAVGHRKVPQPV